MKHLFLVLALVVASLGIGCAHFGTQAPDEADLQAQQADLEKKVNDKTNELKAQSDDAANQANGQTSEALNQSKSQAIGTVRNSALSPAIFAALIKRMPLIDDSNTLHYANTMGRYIADELVPSLKCRADGTKPSEVHVAIVKSSTASSFSLPGGVVVITTALMQKLKSEDELAGVIANEMVLSVCEKGVPSDLAAQASTNWSDYILQLPTKSIDRADLAFADKYALVTLYRRGYDLTPYVGYISKNETQGRHMWGSERALALTKNIAATPAITPTASARNSRFQAAKSKSL